MITKEALYTTGIASYSNAAATYSITNAIITVTSDEILIQFIDLTHWLITYTSTYLGGVSLNIISIMPPIYHIA